MRSTSVWIAGLAEDAPAGDAVEGHQPQRRPVVEGGEGVAAGGVGGFEDGGVVAVHEPGQAALGDVRHAQQRPVGEVRAGHEADLFAAAAAEAQRVGEGEADEGLRVDPGGEGGVEPVEVDVEGRGVVEGQDPVAFAAGDDHRVADPAPAVADADPEGGVGGDGGGHDGVAQHPPVVELGGGLHAQVVTGAAADEGDAGADDPVGAPHDLRLVPDEPVGEEQQDLVLLVAQAVESRRRPRRRPPGAGRRRHRPRRWRPRTRARRGR